MLHAETITGLLEERAQESSNSTAFYSLDATQTWQGTSWTNFLEEALAIAGGLRAHGVSKGRPVGIMARTSPSWDSIQFGALMAGGIIVGMDSHDLDDNINHIIELTDLRTLVLQEAGLLKKVSSENSKRLETIITVDPPEQTEPDTLTLSQLKETGREAPLSPEDRPEPSDAATIIFTSGTTGKPKGILYRHEQVTKACRSILEAFPDIEQESHLPCWLPLSNLFQRIINFCGVANGATIFYVENPQDIMKHLPAINPHVFIGVPRFFEKLHNGMMAEINKQPAWMRTLAKWAIRTGEKRAAALRNNTSPDPVTNVLFSILDPLVLKKLRQALGNNLLFMISGSAPMPLWLLERFHGMGLLILEAYGISENIIPMTMNRPDQLKFGTVGKPINGNDIKVLDDGEVLVKGAGVFSGYFGQKNQDNPVGKDGYLRTGDLASVDPDGFLTLTGRKSEIFKTSTGRKIAPVGIEERLRKIDYVEHAVVMGAQRKSLIALLSLEPHALKKKVQDLGLDTSSIKDKIPESFFEFIRRDIENQVQELPTYQQPSGLLLTLKPFTIEGGELTSNLKVRRKKVQEKYQQAIEGVYQKVESQPSTSTRQNEMTVECL